MPRPIRRMALFAFVTALAFPAGGSAGIGPPRNLVDAFVRAWNAHDAKAMSELFTEDADFVTAEGNWWKGRAWIQSQLERAHSAKLKTTMMVETNTTVRRVRPDVAVMRFEWEVSGERGPDGKPLITRHGIMQIVAVNQPSGWRIVSAQDTGTMPPV